MIKKDVERIQYGLIGLDSIKIFKGYLIADVMKNYLTLEAFVRK